MSPTHWMEILDFFLFYFIFFWRLGNVFVVMSSPVEAEPHHRRRWLANHAK